MTQQSHSYTYILRKPKLKETYVSYFFTHPPVDEHLGCFHVLAIVNRAVMNTGIHVSFSILVSSGYMPEWDIGVGLLGHMVVLFLVF